MDFFHYGEKSSLLLFFFLHGLVFAGLMLVRGLREQRTSDCLFALFLALCASYISPFMLGYAGWYGKDGFREFLFFMPLQQLLLIGPIMYFYIHSLLTADFHFTKKDYWHLLPAGLYNLYILIAFVVDISLEEYYFYANGRDKDLDFWHQMLGWISMVFYFGLSLFSYRKYRLLIVHIYSFADSVVYRWIKRYLLAAVGILILRLLFFILNPEWGEFGSKFWYYLCFSILFYYIAIAGYGQSIKTQLLHLKGFLKEDDLYRVLIPAPREEGIEKAERAETVSSIEAEELAMLKSRLSYLMEKERLYENPSLNLFNIAELLEVTPKKTSQLINQSYGMNFNDYVNRYRCQSVAEALASGKQQQLTLLSIALDCGFNSKSTFNRSFKKHMGKTPRQYMLELVPNHDLER